MSKDYRLDIADADGVRVLSDQCTTCLLRPGNLMELRPGRLQEMLDGCLRDDSYIICHDTLPRGRYSKNSAVRPAVCRGYFDRFGNEVSPLRFAKRMGFVKEVPRPEDLPATE